MTIPTPLTRPGYSVERTFASPAFWRGVAAARQGDNSLQNHRAISRAEIIEAKCAAGNPLAGISEFGEWMASGVGRRARP